MKKVLTAALFALATATAPFAASAQSLTEAIQNAMAGASEDVSALVLILQQNPGSQAAIAAVAVQARPDLANPIATAAAVNGGPILEVANAMAEACSACAFDISDALEAVSPDQAASIRAAVADGASNDDVVADSFVSIRVVSVSATVESEEQDTASPSAP